MEHTYTSLVTNTHRLLCCGRATKRKGMKSCSNGHENPVGNMFCGSCGEPLEVVKEADPILGG